LVVASEPHEQRHNIELSLTTVSVALVFPTDEDFVDGVVFLTSGSPDSSAENSGSHRLQTSRPSVTFRELPHGVYTAGLHSTDDKWQGKSDAFTAKVGDENIVLVDVRRKPTRIPVGNWSETGPRSDYRSGDFDASMAIDRRPTAASLRDESGARFARDHPHLNSIHRSFEWRCLDSAGTVGLPED
jgi:hypothetical protein